MMDDGCSRAGRRIGEVAGLATVHSPNLGKSDSMLAVGAADRKMPTQPVIKLDPVDRSVLRGQCCYAVHCLALLLPCAQQHRQ